jgi:hypothetical protein
MCAADARLTPRPNIDYTPPPRLLSKNDAFLPESVTSSYFQGTEAIFA